MGCNWELFEMRVIVWPSDVKSPQGQIGQGLFFVDVYPDLRSFGIPDFQGHNDQCNFSSVFSQLIKFKALHFSCRQKNNQGGEFARVQKAEQDNETLLGAQLYVHRRDRSEMDTIMTGIGMMLDDVTVAFTSAHNGIYHAQLFGKKASRVNF